MRSAYLPPVLLAFTWTACATDAPRPADETPATRESSSPGVRSAAMRGPRDRSDFTSIREDGYPLNVNPEVVSAEEASIEDDDIVMGTVVNGEARAYPVNYMNGPFNEVVNDRLGGVPIAPSW